jgi:hypothetical protein
VQTVSALQSSPNQEQEVMRLNLVLLSLALCAESISRPDPETFLQEQMRLWNQGSEMWLHELLESEGNVGFYEDAPEFLAVPLPLIPAQTHQKRVVRAEALPISLQETG